MAADGVEATLAWLRALDPPPIVSALTSTGIQAPVPDELQLRSSPPRPLADGSPAPAGLEAILAEDRADVLRALDRARQRGLGQARVRAVDGARVQIHFLDLRAEHGIVLVASLVDDGTVESPAIGHDDLHEPSAPRVAHARLDGTGNVVDLDDDAVRLLGWSLEERRRTPTLSLLHPEDHDRVVDNWLAVLTEPGRRHRYRARHRCRDGSWLWVEITNLNRLEDPAHGDVLTEIVDISEEMAVHEALREREQLLRELTDALPVGVLQFTPGGEVVHENEQLAAIVGAPGLAGLLASAVDEDRRTLELALARAAAGRVPEPLEVRLQGERVCRVTLRPLLDDDGEAIGGLACVDDVTEEARLRRQLEIRATVDDLTGCLTRSAVLRALDDQLHDPPGTGAVFVDLDRFKPVNDALGHAAGDELLAAVGHRLRAAVRDVDLVGRLGGDEFLVVCPGVPSTEIVAAIAMRVAAALDAPVPVGDESVVAAHASIGVAWAAAGTEPADLVARADAAMYESKRQSRADPNSPTKLTISPG